MNSSENTTLAPCSENSETGIKRDLRALRRERTVRLEDAGPWDGDPFEQLRQAMEPADLGALGLVNHGFTGHDDRAIYGADEATPGGDVTLEWKYPQEYPPAAAGLAWHVGPIATAGSDNSVLLVASEDADMREVQRFFSAITAERDPSRVLLVTPEQYREFIGLGVRDDLLSIVRDMPADRCAERNAGREPVRRGKGKRSRINRTERWR